MIGMATPLPSSTGLEGVALPTLVEDGDKLAATAKALTAAYLSSGGNAFSTRTAGQIVQKNFNPGELDQPGGPLFGVQFSQLPCSDFTSAASGGTGPKSSPLGLAADPGGFPLYKSGVLVGGVGALADGRYSIDSDIMDFDQDTEHRNVDEQIALAATFGFSPAPHIRADRITLEGKTLRYTDVEFAQLASDPASTPEYEHVLAGIDATEIVAGTVFGQAESGIRVGRLGDVEAFVFVAEDSANRFPPKDGAGAADTTLSAEETRQLLVSALAVAARTRSQIRRPLGSSARVTVSVVDAGGDVLGMARSNDAPVFGADVSLQKARTAALFSSPDAATLLEGMPAADYSAIDRAPVAMAAYMDAARAVISPDALSGGVAFTSRAIGNLSRPNYPDGIEHNPNGPFSKSPAAWSVFSTGLQLDISFNGLLRAIGGNVDQCAGKRAANGIQIFPGGVPIYRHRVLVGAIGISGDGVDQDDMIGFLGIHEAGLAVGSGIGNAPLDMRADILAPQGERLRYVQCPQAPYLDTGAQNVCSGK